MSTAIFPSLAGLAFPVKRTPQFKTQTIEAASGKEVRVAMRSGPRYLYEVDFEVLRQYSSFAEFQQILAFYNNRLGGFDSFLFDDVDDRAAIGQVIGIGDGVTTGFQMFRAVGSPGTPKWFDIIFAPNQVTNVYLGGVVLNAANYSVGGWGTSTPGVITFNSPPGQNVTVSADFSWYWPCRFLDDTMEITKFYTGFYSVSSLKFTTII